MNKPYLKSLGKYLALNFAIYCTLMLCLSTPLSFAGVLINTSIGVMCHKFFIWKG